MDIPGKHGTRDERMVILYVVDALWKLEMPTAQRVHA
jgi:hypothetical protein